MHSVGDARVDLGRLREGIDVGDTAGNDVGVDAAQQQGTGELEDGSDLRAADDGVISWQLCVVISASVLDQHIRSCTSACVGTAGKVAAWD